jgi:hypothetical protein
MAKFTVRSGTLRPLKLHLVCEEVITERDYYGDVVQNRRLLRGGDQVNPDVSLGNSISIVADAYAREHFFAIRYAEWAGVRWTVQDVEVQPPASFLRSGGGVQWAHGLIFRLS